MPLSISYYCWYVDMAFIPIMLLFVLAALSRSLRDGDTDSHLLLTFVLSQPLMLFCLVVYTSCLIIVYMSASHVSFLFSFSCSSRLLLPIRECVYDAVHDCIVRLRGDKCQNGSFSCIHSVIHRLLLLTRTYWGVKRQFFSRVTALDDDGSK